MKIVRHSPLSVSDVRVGDYIMAIGGKEIHTVADMRKIIDTYRPGDKVTVVYEHNGKTYETEIILAATPENN